MNKKKDNKGKINIELDEKIAEGTYSNLAIINHSVSEFVIDFISIMPGSPKNKVKSRIIITPQHAKKLSKALNDNINAKHAHNIDSFLFKMIYIQYLAQNIISKLWLKSVLPLFLLRM